MIPPSFDETVNILIEAKLRGLQTSDIGQISSYDRTKQKCSVQPMIARQARQENGDMAPRYMPIIPNVPVVFPGGGDNSETWDLKPGDTVLIVYLARSGDLWLRRGGGLTDPKNARKHDHNDAVVIPSLRSFAEAIGAEGVSEDGMVKRWRGQLFLGSATATDPAVRVSDNAKLVTAISSAIAALETAGILTTAIDVAIAEAQPTGDTPDPQTIITLGILKTALVVDPSAGALQALRDALESIGFPSGSPRVKLE